VQSQNLIEARHAVGEHSLYGAKAFQVDDPRRLTYCA
jgi:hypothetical protein